MKDLVKEFRKHLKERLELYIDTATKVDDIINILFALTEMKRRDFLTEDEFKILKEKSRKRLKEIVYG